MISSRGANNVTGQRDAYECPLWVISGHWKGSGMSALPPKADIRQRIEHVCFVPCVDGSGLASQNFTSQPWSVQPCVRPVDAPPNRGSINSAHIHGTHVPVEEPSTALIAAIGFEGFGKG